MGALEGPGGGPGEDVGVFFEEGKAAACVGCEGGEDEEASGEEGFLETIVSGGQLAGAYVCGDC